MELVILAVVFAVLGTLAVNYITKDAAKNRKHHKPKTH